MIPVVKGWEDWITEPHPAGPGSALKGDDKLLPSFPTSRAAMHGIASAIDHLGLLMDALHKTKTSRPFAYYTLARAAVFSSARTIWVLSPTQRPERQKNGLWVAHEEARQRRALASLEREIRPETDTPERAQEWVDEVRLAGARLGIEWSRKPTDTAMIEAAAAWMDRDGRGQGQSPGQSLRLLWRIHSGYAHGLSWPTAGRPETVVRNPDGSGKVTIKANIEDLGIAASVAMTTIRQAKALYEERAANHR